MADEKKPERTDSEYIVGEMVDVQYHRHDPELKTGEAHPALKRAQVFLPVMEGGKPKRFLASGATNAIRAHTGRGENAKVGRWKAIAFSSWKGTEVVERVVQDQRSLLEDE